MLKNDGQPPAISRFSRIEEPHQSDRNGGIYRFPNPPSNV